MRKPSALLTSAALLLLTACAELAEPPRVAIDASAEDVRVLGGTWHGEFWGPDGRGGPIRFSLIAEEGETVARGDVTMLGGLIEDRLRPANPGEHGAISEILSIGFVRVDSATETVTGSIEPYRDPECDCVVSTTFTGVISRDRIRGSFLTRGGAAYLPRTGRWEVRRVDPESP